MILIGQALAYGEDPRREPFVFHARPRSRHRRARNGDDTCTRDMGEGVNLMKKLNVRALETLKTTAAAYGHCPIVRA